MGPRCFTDDDDARADVSVDRSPVRVAIRDLYAVSYQDLDGNLTVPWASISAWAKRAPDTDDADARGHEAGGLSAPDRCERNTHAGIAWEGAWRALVALTALWAGAWLLRRPR